jgi:ABC-type branched-subunit amino acid transport system ATPase component
VLEVDRVNKRFGGLQAIKDVSLTGASGEILGVIGPNGAGKSTLFNLITGVHTTDSGTIRFGEHELTGLPAHERARLGLARTFQLVHLVEGMRVVDNVSLGLYAGSAGANGAAGLLKGLTGTGRRARADRMEQARQALRTVGIEQRATDPARLLTYGERRLVEVARALAGDPPVLLLDEPAAGLNAAEAERLAEVIASLRRPGRLILLVEHNVPFVMGLSDHVVVLDQGKRIAMGTPQEVQRDGAVIEAYLGSADEEEDEHARG